jgi:succinate-acetate transporter protein
MVQQAQQQQQPEPQPQNDWANPGPWSLFGIAALTGCAGFFNAGLLPPTTAPLLVGIVVACILPQVLAGLINFKRGEILIGTLNGLFGTVATIGVAATTWMLISAPKPGAITPEIMAVFWIILFIAMEIAAVGFGRMSWFLMLGIAEVGASFLCLGLGKFVLGGWLLMIFAAFCLYLGAALLWAEVFQRPILPIGRPAFK